MIRTKYGLSPWVEEIPRKRRLDLPRFRGPHHAGVAVIGGGLTGCCTAYALAAAGVDVVMLEADRVGVAGAGRSSGVLQGEPPSSFRDLELRHGRRAARAIFNASRRAVLELAATARRIGIKSGTEVGDAVRILSRFGGVEKAMVRELASRTSAGLDGTWLKGVAAARFSAAENVAGGIKLKDWGRANPYRLVLGFAAAALDRGAVLYERSPARRVKVGRKLVEIQTPGGVLTTDTVIVCTGEPTDLFRPLKRHLRADEAYVVMTEKVPAAIRKQLAPQNRIITDSETPPHLVRWTDDDRLVIAGADQPRTAERGRDKVLVQRTGQLMYELLRTYPAISGVQPAFGWDVPIGVTADQVMYAGPHRNYPRHLFTWGTRHDPAQSFLASRILLRHVLGKPEKDDAFFAFTRG